MLVEELDIQHNSVAHMFVFVFVVTKEALRHRSIRFWTHRMNLLTVMFMLSLV